MWTPKECSSFSWDYEKDRTNGRRGPTAMEKYKRSSNGDKTRAM